MNINNEINLEYFPVTNREDGNDPVSPPQVNSRAQSAGAGIQLRSTAQAANDQLNKPIQIN